MVNQPNRYRLSVLAAMLLVAASTMATRAVASKKTSTPYSSFISGPLGLNTVPNARMDKTGVVRFGVSNLDPYTHAFIGFQIADPLYINLRQSFETSNIFEDNDRLYPGVDLKLRLLKETRSRPEVSIGLQSAVGHKRMAGEYITASKRYKDFDFTAGLGWGRFGTAGHFGNPLKELLSHFDGPRDLDGEEPHDPSDWFTGEEIGFFGGVEYFTPLKGLSLKADYGADYYAAERAALTDFNRPAPWSVGLNYQPRPGINAAIAVQGNDKIMGRLAFSSNVKNWRDPHPRTRVGKHNKVPLRSYRTDLTLPSQMEISAQRESIQLYDADADLYAAEARLKLDPQYSSPYQIGRAAVHMSNHGGPAVEKLSIRPYILGLEGPRISLLRKDLEHTAHHEGSSDEMWASAEFDTRKGISFKRANRYKEDLFQFKNYKLSLDNQISLSEEDSGLLYRTSLLIDSVTTEFFGLLDSGFSWRVNLADNLLNIRQFRPFVPEPIRSDVDLFAQRTLAIDKAFTGLTHSFHSDLHVALAGGYLEEMYAGFGGEILYRPFKSRFAIGAEAWRTYKRDPFTGLNLGLTNYATNTAHLNVYYDVPYHDLTLKAKLGRYLAQDIGGELTLNKTFKNGAQLEGFVSYSDQKDFDIFGGSTQGHHGVRLSLPLGGYKYAPRHAEIRLRAEPFARDTVQSIASPLPLYDLTTPLSYKHLAQHWPRITTDHAPKFPMAVKDSPMIFKPAGFGNP